MKKKYRKIFSYILLSVLLVNSLNLKVFASEINEQEDIVVDKIISKEEYIKAISEYENITYDEAEKMIYGNQGQARILPETVVVIHRTLYKNVSTGKPGDTGKWKLMCQVYIEAIRDNVSSKYIGIQAVRAPYVDLVYNSNPIGSTLSGTPEATHSGKKYTVYFNGTITYSIKDLQITVDLAPGVSISGGTGFNIRYNVNAIFNGSI